MKATAIAPSNIAFIKYWGKKDKILKLPENGSISMCLSDLLTTTTVEFDNKYQEDEIIINNKSEKKTENKVFSHIEKIRQIAGKKTKAKIVTVNNFPTGTGLSSSASGFAALTVAGTTAAGLHFTEKELSILARQGSGSACRSIPDGFVEWLDGNSSDTSYGKTLYPPNHWKIVDIVVIISSEKKEISSSLGMSLPFSSPFYETRLKKIKNKLTEVKKYIENRDFLSFGEMVEAEALELHAIMLTSRPSLVYLLPETIFLIIQVQKWRKEGLPVYFTLNTGQNIHILCEEKNALKIVSLLNKMSSVYKIILNKPAYGTKLSINHLF